MECQKAVPWRLKVKETVGSSSQFTMAYLYAPQKFGYYSVDNFIFVYF